MMMFSLRQTTADVKIEVDSRIVAHNIAEATRRVSPGQVKPQFAFSFSASFDEDQLPELGRCP